MVVGRKHPAESVLEWLSEAAVGSMKFYLTGSAMVCDTQPSSSEPGVGLS